MSLRLYRGYQAWKQPINKPKDNTMDIADKVKWLQEWCDQEELQLVLEGECGFGRECVGVGSLNDGTYPDYEWYDSDNDNRLDNNGEVWKPQDAYRKHPCVAVLGRGDKAVEQLYRWCKWFSENDFHYKDTIVECTDESELRWGRDHQHQMVKSTK